MLAWARSLMKRLCGRRWPRAARSRSGSKLTAGRQEAQPLGVFQFQEVDRLLHRSGGARGSLSRTSPCDAVGAAANRLVVGVGRLAGAADGGGEDLLDQAGAGAAGARCLGVLACTSSRVKRPCSWIALTMVPLHTPLQPHTSALSGIDEREVVAPWPGVAEVAAEQQVVADLGDVLASLSIWKYHAPSLVSPYSTAPMSLSSLSTTRFRDAPPWGRSARCPRCPRRREVARREHVDAGDLELGRGHRAL